MHSTFVGANWTVRNSEDVAAACLFNFLGGGRSYTSVPKASFASAMRPCSEGVIAHKTTCLLASIVNIHTGGLSMNPVVIPSGPQATAINFWAFRCMVVCPSYDLKLLASR